VWRRPVVTILMLITAVILPLPLQAQQKPVAPTFRSARAHVAASLPRRGGVKPPLRPDLKASATTEAGSSTGAEGTPPKPFTQEQISKMVQAGLGDESGAKLIEQRGIDFAPSEDFYQTLKAAGASEAFLNALRAAVAPGLSPAGNVAPNLSSARNVAPNLSSARAELKFSATTASTTASPEPASAKKPLNQVQVFALLVGQVPSHRVTMLVQERGIDFEPTDDYLQEVRLAGGEGELISALKSAKVTKPATVDPAAQARQLEVRQHVARGAELAKKGHYAEAEQAYRAALLLDSQNAEVYVSLAYVLSQQEKWDDAVSAGREALRLNPNDYLAHLILGDALENKGGKGGTIAGYREALRFNPNDAKAHYNLGIALGSRGDNDGMIAEEREALRLNPNNSSAHFCLGFALERKGDRQGALEEYRAAYMLDPKNATYKRDYERLLEQVNQ